MMRKDGSNNRVATVVIGAIVAAALTYFLPVYGYRDATARTDALRARYEEKVRQMYSPVRPVHYGSDAGATDAKQLKEQFSSDIADVATRVTLAEDESCMKFPAWTVVPQHDRRDPVVYYVQVLSQKKFEIRTRWQNESGADLPGDLFGSKNYWIW